MQHLSCTNFFIFICPIVGYIFFSLLAAKGHISMKINFIVDPVGAEVSANLCQEIQNDGREEVSVFYFCTILSCFPNNGAREDLDTGSIFLPCSSPNNG